MGLFSKMAAKAAAKSGSSDKKFLLVCPNCGEKMVVRVEIGGVSLGGKATYKVINNATGETVRQVTFGQKDIQRSGNAIFNSIVGAVDCPKCGISMVSSTKV